MESTDSSAAAAGGGSGHPNLPPGFRFHPTDEELVIHYLKKKVSCSPLPVSIIAEIDLYKYDPWELPGKASFGENEWYFFSPRDRKYPNGTRPNRAATSGYWKATGTDKPVMTGGGTQKVGVKKVLVFYRGKPPKGVKTDWIMHEYRLVVSNKISNRPPQVDQGKKIKLSLRLDDWVLCRIYKKSHSKAAIDYGKQNELATVDDMMMPISVPPSFNVASSNQADNTKLFYIPNKLSSTFNNNALIENEHNTKLFYLPNKLSSTFNNNALIENERALYELGLINTSSNTSSMSQLASPSLKNPVAANSFSLKRPLPQQHFFWLDGEDQANNIVGEPSSSSKRATHNLVQDDNSNIGAMVSLQQVLSSEPSSLHQFSPVDDGGNFRQPYQPQAGLNWYPT